MFLQLLRAGGGERRLRDLVNRGIVHHRQSNYLGDYYELAIPLFDAWVRDSKIWEQMLVAAQSAQSSWYPARHRPRSPARRGPAPPAPLPRARARPRLP